MLHEKLKRRSLADPVSQPDHGAAPDSVTHSPRQQQQARRISALHSYAGAVGATAQLMQSQQDDGRNWWQRRAPYLLGGQAAGEDRGYFARNLPTLLGGQPVPQVPVTTDAGAQQQPPQDGRNWWQRRAPYLLGGQAAGDDRGYLARIMPAMLGGQPVPHSPTAEDVKDAEDAEQEQRSLQKAPALTRKQLIKLEQQASKQRRRQEAAEARSKALDKSDDRLESIAQESPDVDLGLQYEAPQSKSSKKRAAVRARKQEEARREEAREQAQMQERLAATRSLPRRVIRYDRDFASATNRSGQGKSHRIASDLHPAGNTRVSAVEQLHQDSPHKGSSDRTSFSSLRAANANDYSAGGTRPSVEFKARKHARARIKGKADALGFDSLSAGAVIREVDSDTSTYATTQVLGRDDKRRSRKTSARNFAGRDGESQAIGTIPARFLRWSDQVGDDPADSDSDDELTDEE